MGDKGKIRGPVNGTPQPSGKVPRKKIAPPSNGANKGGSGCLIALLTFAALGTGWLSMLLTGSGWTS